MKSLPGSLRAGVPTLLVLLALLVAFGVAACTSPVAVVEAIPVGVGEIGVTLAGDVSGSRGILGSDASSSIADAYELIACSAAGNQASVVVPGQTTIIRLSPGKWRLVVLAGLKRSATSMSCALLGSALVDVVEIVEGKRTTVDLSIKAIDFSYEIKGSMEWESDALICVAGQSRNTAVGMFVDGSSTTRHPRLKSAELFGGYKDVPITGASPDNWKFEFAAPIAAGTTTVNCQFIGANVTLLDAANAWIPVDGLTRFDWKWLNRYEMTDTSPLAPLVERKFEATAPATGINLGVHWE